ncbi:MAG: LysR family transcriptional regulator [Myxococcota bacterium]
MESSDLASLLALNALLHECSVSGAAQQLGLSTPAMSHALGRLRDRFDDPLLVRAGRSMVLTPRAEQLRARVKDALVAAGSVFEPMEQQALAEISSEITLALTDYVTTLIGESLDRSVAEQAPKLDLRYLLNAPDDPERLRNGTIDLAIGIYRRLPPEVRRRRVVSDQLVCVVRSAHPVVRRRPSLTQYCKLPHIQVAPRGRPGGVVDSTLKGMARSRRVVRAVPFFRFALELASQTDYVLTIPEKIAQVHAKRLGLTIYKLPFDVKPYALSLVWHPRSHADHAHRFLRDAITEAFAEHGGISHDLT